MSKQVPNRRCETVPVL